jgi:hypothetical protein
MCNPQARARTASVADHRGSDSLPFPKTQTEIFSFRSPQPVKKAKADRLTMNLPSRASTFALAGDGSGLEECGQGRWRPGGATRRAGMRVRRVWTFWT